MGERKWLMLTLFACLSVSSCGIALNVKHANNLPTFNHTLARILVEYASAVYLPDLTELINWTCSRCDGLTTGFEVIELIVDVQHCLQAYVGVARDLNAVVIAFRGTQGQSLQNWVEDLYWQQLDLNYPGMPDAMVHHGFYYAYHNTTIRPGILDAVEYAKNNYGELNIIVTGHSMGGAMASFCGLDLIVNDKAQKVQVITFGQPRVGNAAFASYYSKLVPDTFRITHDHDIVPHLPPYYAYFRHKTYHHFPREVWLYDVGSRSSDYEGEKVCDGSGEDPSCSRSVMGNSIFDHLVYYGVPLTGGTWKSCSVIGPHLEDNVIIDPEGNFMMSKFRLTTALKMSTESDARGETV